MERQEWTVRIHQRPWHEWVLWVVWVALLAFFANLWLASGSELEPQAATIGAGARKLRLSVHLAAEPAL